MLVLTLVFSFPKVTTYFRTRPSASPSALSVPQAWYSRRVVNFDFRYYLMAGVIVVKSFLNELG
jgi:hypothetical protein